MLLKNLAAGVTQSFVSATTHEMWMGVSGTGSVAIEFMGDDGIFRSYPQGTFTAPAANMVVMKAGQYRFNVTGGPITLDLAS